MWSLGFAEGVLTAPEIVDEIANLKWPVLVHYGKLPSTDPKDAPELVAWLDTNEAWTAAQVAANPHDPFWRAQGLVATQFDGLLAGVQAAAADADLAGGAAAVTKFDLQMVNGVGDFFDLIPATTPHTRRNFFGGGDVAAATNSTGSSTGDSTGRPTTGRRRPTDSSPVTSPVSTTTPPMSNKELEEYVFEAGRCSGLIKALPDFSNIFFSHASWWS
jgi:hypothetical protein